MVSIKFTAEEVGRIRVCWDAMRVYAYSLLILIALTAGVVHAQTITVHLINAKNGKPIAGKNITFEWSGGLLNSSVAMTDRFGVARIEVPKGQTSFSLMGGPKVGKEPYRVAYLSCNASLMTQISVADVVAKGLVPGNVCSKRTYSRIKPGEVVYYAELKPWWMPDMQ